MKSGSGGHEQSTKSRTWPEHTQEQFANLRLARTRSEQAGSGFEKHPETVLDLCKWVQETRCYHALGRRASTVNTAWYQEL
jgi:hypothetical protein